MSSNKKELAEKEKVAYSKGKKEGLVMALVAVAFFAAGCISTALIMNKIHDKIERDNPNDVTSSVVDTNSNTDKDVLDRDLVVGDARTEELNKIVTKMDTLRNSNVAFVVETADGYDGYMYNKYKECIQQNSDSSVSTLFTSDGHSVRVNAADGTIALDGSIDILTTCENILGNAVEGTDGYSVYTTSSETMSDGVTYSSCIINIKGFDACKTLYENLGGEMAESAIQKLKEIVDTEYASSNNLESFDWTPEFEYIFVYSDKEHFGMQCNCIINGEASNNWYTDGYQETAEWKLSDSWTSVDWETNTTENFDSICEKLTTELEKIDKVLAEAEGDTSSNEGTESKTESTTENSVDSKG